MTSTTASSFKSELMKLSKTKYRSSNERAFFELFITLVPYVGCWFYYLMTPVSIISPGVGIVASAFMVRVFIIMHDCGHGSMFELRVFNTWIGRLCGFITLTPYFMWTKEHAHHHKTSGNLDEESIGEIWTMTVTQFNEASSFRKKWYRFFRKPITLFVIGPIAVFWVFHRWKSALTETHTSTSWTNWMLLIYVSVMIFFFGLKFVIFQLGLTIFGGGAGVWLFYIQHQYEHAYRKSNENWDLSEASLYGSSYYELPRVLNWFSGNIGIHHVHHLVPGIPFYRLPHVLKDYPDELLGDDVTRLTLRSSPGCLKWKLWDEEQGKMITFPEYKVLYG